MIPPGDHARLHGPIGGLDRRRLAQPVVRAAADLVGALLVREETGTPTVVARVVETEAYHQDDPASHSHRGRTPRTEPMFEVAGTSYVYRSYGVHWCLNVSAEARGVGAAILVRAAVVLQGSDAIAARHPVPGPPRHLLRGPGRLTRGLDLDAARHGRGDLIEGVGGLRLADDGWRPARGTVTGGPRVGVSVAADLPWRFVLAGASEVSAYRRSPRAPSRAR